MRSAPSSSVSVARRARGFTLIELMTAVIVAGVLLAVAGPGLADFVRSSRVNGAQSELVSSMMLARSEAAKRAQVVQLLASSGSVGTDFTGGWVVGWDKNGDGLVDTSAGSDEVIRAYPAPANGVLISAAVAASAVRFAATGFLSPPSGFVFNVCDRNKPTKGYQVSLEPVGLTDVKSPVDCRRAAP